VPAFGDDAVTAVAAVAAAAAGRVSRPGIRPGPLVVRAHAAGLI